MRIGLWESVAVSSRMDMPFDIEKREANVTDAIDGDNVIQDTAKG